MPNYLQKLLTEGKENLPALIRKLKGQPALEGEVVGDLATVAQKRILPDIEGELVSQRALNAPSIDVPNVPQMITQNVDEVIPMVAPKSNTLRNIGIGAGIGGAVLADKYLLSPESNEFNEPVSVPKQTKVAPTQVEPEKAVAKSPSTGKASVIDNALQNKAPEIQPSSSKEDTFNNMLEEARQKDAEQGLLFGLLKAAQTGGAAIAGTKADTSFADTQLAKGDEFVGKLKTDEEMKREREKFLDVNQLRDPNSSASIQARDIARKVGLKVSDATTAKELADAGLPIGNLLTQKLAIDARKETAQLQREAMALAKGEKQEQKADEFAGKHIDTYTKLLHKDYQGLQQAETNAKRAEDIIAQNISGVTPGAGDIAILYNFVKGLDKNSAVREGEISLSKQARSVLGRLDSEVKRLSGGDILDSETRRAFAELIRASADAEKLNFVKQKRNAIAAGAQKGIDPEMLDRAIFADISTKKEIPTESTTIPSGGTVRIQRLKDGKTMTLSSEAAQKYLNDPKFQQVK